MNVHSKNSEVNPAICRAGVGVLALPYMSDEATGPDGVAEAVPALVAGVLPSHEDVLVTRVVGSLIDDPGPALHTDRVAAADVGAELRAVAAAFIVMTLEVLVLVEEDLQIELCVRRLQLLLFLLLLSTPSLILILKPLL